MAEKDYIIVGQGIAGSILAHLLHKNGQKVVIFDRYTEGSLSSSRIAAGIINPITGRRFVKSWRMDELLPVAKRTYQDLEKLLNIPIWHDRNLIRTLHDTEEENNYLLRSTYPDYQNYCGETTRLPFDSDAVFSDIAHPFFNKFYALAETKNAAQVNLPLLVTRLRSYFVDNQLLTEGDFSFNDVVVEENAVCYKNIKAKKIIFADGAAGAVNPYFNWLPFNLDKGELLLVRIPDLNLGTVFKNKISIVPLHNLQSFSKLNNQKRSNTEGSSTDNLYWVGATNAWTFDNDLPTEANKQLILNELRELISCPFEVVAHQSAIRPTVKDRRPFIGWHPKFPVLGIFNGFGTKGASLVPFFAEQLVENVLSNQPLEKEVDISRFRCP